jgi:eukaryotic-like serine/threonine-protein kinase
MTPAEWRDVQDAIEDALDVPMSDRESWLADRFPDRPAIRAEVARLLRAHQQDGPLDRLTAAMDSFAAAPVEQATRIGVWRLHELLGRGGMGSVYRAERADGQYSQRAALKLLRQDVADPDLRRRFYAERQILARIEHPGIARILDGGVTDDGRPWFAMEYVEGLPIDRWCEEYHLGVRRRVMLLRQICTAVQHAHAHLVVHRDLKPANILVTRDGSPKLLDFGIARLLDPDWAPIAGGATGEGIFLLTPDHASPEQLRGDPVGVASDVFQLGLLLFLLVTGRLPRRLADARGSSHGVAEKPSAAAPHALAREIDEDLDTIVLAATRAEPDRRYASVDQLAEDVQRWLDRMPIRARPDTVAYRTRHFVRRHRLVLATATAFALSLSVFSALTAVQARRVEAERDGARRVIGLLSDLFEEPRDPATGRPVQQLLELDAGARSRAARNEEHLREIAGALFVGSPALRRAELARSAVSGATILWVDDNPDANRAEIILLEALGARVSTARTTADALRQASSGGWDVVVSDIYRPGMPGEGLRMLDSLKVRDLEIPVIYYVFNAGPHQDRPLGSFGITTRPDELVHLILDVLERRRL